MKEPKLVEEVNKNLKLAIDTLVKKIKEESLSERDLYDLTLYFEDKVLPGSFWR